MELIYQNIMIALCGINIGLYISCAANCKDQKKLLFWSFLIIAMVINCFVIISN